MTATVTGIALDGGQKITTVTFFNGSKAHFTMGWLPKGVKLGDSLRVEFSLIGGLRG